MTALAGHPAFRRGLPLLLLSGVLLCMPLPLPAADVPANEKAAELQQLRSRIQTLKQVLQEARGKKDKLQNELRDVEQDINRIGKSLRRLAGDMSRQKTRLGELQEQRGELRRDLKHQQKLLGSQVRASYAMGRQEQVKILLNQGDPGTVQRALVYFDYLNRSRVDRIQAVSQQLKTLAEVEQRIEVETARLQELRAAQDLEHQKLLQNRDQRKRLLLALTKEITSKDKELDKMLQNEKELQKVLEAVEQALSDIPMNQLDRRPFRERKGRLPWPTQGKISTRFGSERVAGRLRWSGVMIDARPGEEVRAISHGRVAFSDWLRGYGLMLIVDHGDGYMSLYGHNQSLFKEVGEWVEEGELIATVGNSGGQASSSLYFELRANGKPVNPVQWCRRTRHGLVGLNN